MSKRKEYIVQMEVVLAIEDIDHDSVMTDDDVLEYARNLISVNADYENSGSAPEVAGEDATASIAADIIQIVPKEKTRKS